MYTAALPRLMKKPSTKTKTVKANGPVSSRKVIGPRIPCTMYSVGG